MDPRSDKAEPRYHCLVITHTHERVARTLMGVGAQSVRPVTITVAADDDDPAIEAEVARAARSIGRPVRLVLRPRCGESRRAQNRNNAVRAIDPACLREHDVLVFFDGDCIPDPGACAAHLGSLENPGVDVSLGFAVRLTERQTAALTDAHALEGRVADLVDTEQVAGVRAVDRRTRRRVLLRRLGLTKPHKPGILSGNFAVRWRSFAGVNGFDESYTGWGAEDDDIARRLYALGARPRSCMRAALAYHQHHPPESAASWRDNPNAAKLAAGFEVSAKLGLASPADQPTPRIIDLGPAPAGLALRERAGRDDPFFVVGTGRCGSTLLQSMLMSHPEVRMPPETQYFEQLDPVRLGFTDPIPPGEAGAYLDRALTERARMFLGAADGAVGAYADAVRGGLLHARDQFLWICDRLSEETPGRRLGEKTPQHWMFIDRITGIFPDARFVHLVRDPRDVVAGLLEMDWWNTGSARKTARHWRRTVEAAERARRTHGGDRHTIVRYEDLIVEPEPVLRALCDFLGLDFSDSMLDHRASAQRAFPRSEAAYKGLATRAIDPSRVGRYRTRLSPSQIRVIEATAGARRMIRLGYLPDGSVSRPAWSPIEPVIVRTAESFGLSGQKSRAG